MFLLSFPETAIMARQPDASYTAIIKEAREAEQDQDMELAVKLYQRALKKEPHLPLPYERLMILYRKQKKYAEELALLHRAIGIFETFYQQRAEKILQKTKGAGRLSAALARSLGQNNKKDRSSYPQPIPKWASRLAVVKKRLDKRSK
jgi:tetratricopeptide (TPR) repeat protein